MFCKWCGMESETSDVCSWCRHPFPTTAAVQDKQAAEPPEETKETPRADAPAEAAPAATPAAPAAAPSQFDYEELDDDLSPMPFGGPYRPPAADAGPARQDRSVPGPPPAPQPTRPAEQEARPVAPPPAPEPRQPLPAPGPPPPAQPVRPSAPPAYVPPPVSPGRGGPGYTPAAPRQPEDRPALEPLPIRKGPAPGVIPIARQPERPPAGPPSTPAPAAPIPPTVLPLRQAPPPPPIPIAEPAPAPPPPEPVPLPLAGPPAAPEAGDNGLAEPVELELPTIEELTEEEPQIGLHNRTPGVGATPPPTILPHAAQMTHQAQRDLRAPARTWYCRWCGMESENPDTCTWCRRDMRNLPSQGASPGRVTITHGPGAVRRPAPKPHSAPPVRVPTPPANTAKPAAATATAPPPTPAKGVPTFGTFQAQKSKYYSDKVLDPVSGAHYDADTGETIDVKPVLTVEDLAQDERAELWRLIGVYAAVLTGIILLVGLVVRATGTTGAADAAAIGFAAFGAGFAMPVVRLFPFGEDDAEDIWIAAALIIILGPLVGGVCYGVWMLLRQGEGSPAIVCVFVSYLVIRLLIDLAAGVGIADVFHSMLPFADKTFMGFVKQWLALLGIAGWFAASTLRKFDE